ncbi:MAG: hypothetical protein A2Y97_06180 [Nitrospirae bacterium RBG_13_39_12]|nr:MAG: hypothetical protein A2Y97_06180 [Nitrospirae bacterium RBG_13_39_12]
MTVKNNVIGNPHAPEDTLSELSDDKDIMVRISVSKNPKTNRETTKKLVEDKSYTVRKNATEPGRGQALPRLRITVE